MKTRLADFVLERPLASLVLVVIVTAVFGSLATGIRFDHSIESYFLAEDIRNYDSFLDEFGSDEFVAVAFSDDNVFTPENFTLIDRLSRRIETLPHVRRVISLTNAQTVLGRDDSVVFEDLAPELPMTEEQLELVRVHAYADAFIPGTLVSDDGTKTVVAAEIDHIIGEFDYKVVLLKALRGILTEETQRSGKHFSVAGTAVLDDALFRYTERDQTIFSPIMVAVIAVVSYCMFGHFVSALLPLLVVLCSMAWTYGFMALLGYKINVISTIIGPLLMAVGIADAMHIIADYRQEAAKRENSKHDAIRYSFLQVVGPCAVTSLTTCLGLLSLLSASLVPIRQFGLVAAFGVASAFVITVLLLPGLLRFVSVPKLEKGLGRTNGGFDRALDRLGSWRRRRSIALLLLCALAIAPATYGLGHLTIGTNTLDYFRPGDPVRSDTEWIDENVGGTTSLEFLVEAHDEQGLTNPALLRKMEEFQAYLRTVPGITKVFSVTDMIKMLNRAFEEGRSAAFRIPDSAAAVAQELLVVEGTEDLDEFLSEDRQQGRITARVAMKSSQQLAHQAPMVVERMHDIFGDSATTTPTGLVYLMHRMERYLLSSQIRSFGLAFFVITLVMMVALRDLRLGLLAMVPNLLPIAFVLALMPALGIALDVGTVMLASVALGLVVDDTTHFLYRLREQPAWQDDTYSAMRATMHATGRPIIFTSIALALGFSVLVLASFNPLIHFGILASLVIALALFFDLVVLPAMLGLMASRRR